VIDEGGDFQTHPWMEGQGCDVCVKFFRAIGFPDSEIRMLACNPPDFSQFSRLNKFNCAIQLG
jgi:hypothetical protein